MRLVGSLRAIVLSAALVGSVTATAADVVEITSASSLGANDSIGWLQLGPAGRTVAEPVPVTSSGGLAATLELQKPLTDLAQFQPLARVEQGSGWAGDFTPGAHLIQAPVLYTTLLFEEPVSGVGAQIQSASPSFTASMEVWDSYPSANRFAFSRIGLFGVSGTNTGTQDGSAPFLGAASSTADIWAVRFTTSQGSGTSGYALDTLYLTTDPKAIDPAPEPSALLLIGAGAVGLGYYGRKGARRGRRPPAAAPGGPGPGITRPGAPRPPGRR
jgi:PEP-CTERM motif-containing protein